MSTRTWLVTRKMFDAEIEMVLVESEPSFGGWLYRMITSIFCGYKWELKEAKP